MSLPKSKKNRQDACKFSEPRRLVLPAIELTLLWRHTSHFRRYIFTIGTGPAVDVLCIQNPALLQLSLFSTILNAGATFHISKTFLAKTLSPYLRTRVRIQENSRWANIPSERWQFIGCNKSQMSCTNTKPLSSSISNQSNKWVCKWQKSLFRCMWRARNYVGLDTILVPNSCRCRITIANVNKTPCQLEE